MTKMLLIIVELFYKMQLKQYQLKIDISGGISGQNTDL